MTSLSIVLFALSAVLANSVAQAPPPPSPAANIPAAIAKFAPKLFSDIGRQFSTDLVISPFGAFDAVTLVSQGAIGTVYDKLVAALGISNNKAVAANQFQNYNQELQTIAGSAEVITFNEIFVQNNFKLNQTFQNVAATKFSAGVLQTDFSDFTFNSDIDLINSFIKRRTHNIIQDVVVENAGMISSNTRAVAVNGIYFGGSFLHRFNRIDSFEGRFNGTGRIGYMTTIDTFNYAELPDLNARAIEMQYVNSNLTLVVVLPTENKLNELVANLKDFDWEKITNQMQQKTVEVTMPKFEAKNRIMLNSYLTNLGMGDMFQSSASSSIPLMDPTIPLIVTGVHTSCNIRVDECGTEFAGGTADIATTLVLAATPPINPVIPFRANRPFVYFVRDRTEKSILFSGYVKKPVPPSSECSQQSEGQA